MNFFDTYENDIDDINDDEIDKLKNEDKNYVNKMAILAIIFAFIFPFLGWVFGEIGLYNSTFHNGKGKILSIGSIIIASIIVALLEFLL